MATSRFIILSMATAMTVAMTACSSTMKMVVANDIDIERDGEMAEVDASVIKSRIGERFVITDATGTEIPYQLTHDGLVIFPAKVGASSSATYTIKKGTPAPVDTIVTGRLFPERKDDMAWENDRSAYRAYGPALQRSGERAFGYDIWTKSVPHRILEKRYYDDRVNRISFHVDHGNGMDVYAVGPTLGGGTSALTDAKGNLVLPYCFADYEILDQGPLRFTVKLTYNPLKVNSDENVIETRVISLDRGSWLNKTTVRYDGLTTPATFSPGIVVHRQNPTAYTLDNKSRFMSYADLTEKADNGNGTIFVGVVAPDANLFIYSPLDQPAGDAIGHILAQKGYDNATPVTYWWGSGWSKGGMPDMETWNSTLRDYSRKVASPLKIKIK